MHGSEKNNRKQAKMLLVFAGDGAAPPAINTEKPPPLA